MVRIILDGKTHNSIKCNRTQYWGLLAEFQNNAENTGNRDHVILQCWSNRSEITCESHGLTSFLQKQYLFNIFPTLSSVHPQLVRYKFSNGKPDQNYYSSDGAIIRRPPSSLPSFFIFPFRFRLPASHSVVLSTSLGLLHADGKLCVYFKNRFATLHIPALNPASCCPATLTGPLLPGWNSRLQAANKATGNPPLTLSEVKDHSPTKRRTLPDSSRYLSFSSSFLCRKLLYQRLCLCFMFNFISLWKLETPSRKSWIVQTQHTAAPKWMPKRFKI